MVVRVLLTSCATPDAISLSMFRWSGSSNLLLRLTARLKLLLERPFEFGTLDGSPHVVGCELDGGAEAEAAVRFAPLVPAEEDETVLVGIGPETGATLVDDTSLFEVTPKPGECIPVGVVSFTERVGQLAREPRLWLG